MRATLLAFLLHAPVVGAAERPALPEVVYAPPAVYPLDAVAERREATVVLQLDLDESGQVVAARVHTSAGPDFDAAALAVARDFRFTPPRDGLGRPTGARIQYALRFELASVPTVSLEGVLLEGGIRQPLVGLTVRLTGPGEERTATTDDAGRFSWAGLDPGLWTLDLVHESWRSKPVEVAVTEGVVATVKAYAVDDRPWEREAEADEVVEVIGRADAEVSERRLDADEIRVLPGSFGDVVRAVQNLPGIARAPFGLGTLIVRGTEPEDSRYTVDGMEIPLVFHFGGLTTVINGDLLDEVAFLPGDFSTRFGRNLGGRIDLRTRADVPERTNGYVAIDLFQATAFADVRASDRTAVSASLRRSYVDAVLNPILSSAGEPFRAPAYWDGQVRLVHRMPGRGTFDALVMVSDDRFRALGRDAIDVGATAATLGFVSAFQQAKLAWRAPIGAGWRHELSLLAGPQVQRLDLGGEDEAFERRVAIDLREELLYEVDTGASWRIGLDLRMGPESFRFDVAEFGPEEAGDGFLFAPALYVEPTFRWGALTLVTGLRADLVSFAGGRSLWSMDPRLALRFDATPTTSVRASVGRFASFPELRALLEEPPAGEAELGPAWALQSAVGIDQALPHGMSLEVTGYHSQLFDLVVGREDRLRFFTTPPTVEEVDPGPYANAGSGRSYGVELLFRLRQRRLVAWVSATLGRAERTGRDDELAALFAYDQPVILNALASWQLPRRWRLGARARFASGNPYTPVEQAVYDLNGRSYVPLFGDPSSARLPPFWSLDVRVDKEWVFRRWALTLYLDILNATNFRNIEIPTFNADYSRIEGVRGLPIVPVFGLRGSW